MRKIMGLFALAIGLLVAVAATSATFAYFEAQRDVHIEVVSDENELIDLEPLQPYAYTGEGGVLTIAIRENNPNYQEGYGKGVSPDSIYVFEHVFGVSNHLWEGMPICVEINYNDDEYKFFVGDYTGGYGDSPIYFILQPGEMKAVGIVINSTGYDAGDAIADDIIIKAYADLSNCEQG
ncbi:DUF1102 domain-containing protein [Thermococcus sp. 5-4]|uniref:DUF1102 domain-containing protein n=1 Tax=Thermococcus sp. 5-4 TaxID=2008440 RepID=UPI000B49CD94|nr:DUF1102 domain-containing protein [Thermococcus sp. 5-4]ASA76802.1 hypothetical protein CDI07_00305 [Thermococcus sp. 5-4]